MVQATTDFQVCVCIGSSEEKGLFFQGLYCVLGFPEEFRDGLNFAHPSHLNQSILDSPSSEVKHPAGQAALADVCSLVVGLFCRMLREMVSLTVFSTE